MVLQTDYRLGGFPQYFVGERDLMEISPEVQKCVAFLGFNSRGAIDICGTAFFVGVPREDDPDHSDLYVVTARHVIDHIYQKSDDQKAIVRVNMLDGATTDVEYDASEWVHHHDELVDVSVHRWEVPDKADVRYVPWNKMAIGIDQLKKQHIHAGDEVFMSGLFLSHPGRDRNSPIVRRGSIAMVPEEKIRVTGGKIDAYLIETRSTSGISGCPVFLQRWEDERNRRSQRIFFLGLIHGYYGPDSDCGEMPLSERKQMNSGISIVVPAFKIEEVLNAAISAR